MGSLWRSEEMAYVRVVLPSEVAFPFVDDLGRREIIQFVDLNEHVQTFQRRHIREIMQIDEVQRKVDEMGRFLDTYEVPHEKDNNMVNCEPVTKESIEAVIHSVTSFHQRLVNDFYVAEQFKQQLQYEVDFQLVLESSHAFLGQRAEAQAQLEESILTNASGLLADMERGQSNDVAFRFVAGIVNKAQRPVFERQMFLISRGNAFIIFNDGSELDNIGDSVAFIVFYLGKQLERRISKLCSVMGVEVFLRPEDQDRIASKLEHCRHRQSELRITLHRTQHQLKQDLFGVASKIGEWERILLQGKAVYSTLNLFSYNPNTQLLQAEAWVPVVHQWLVDDAVENALVSKGFSVRNSPAMVQQLEVNLKKQTPPTYFRTNKVTQVFQSIVNTYGTPRYREVNPGVFTIITFPFLFGVMYGDVLHGSLLFLFALYLVLNEKKMEGRPMNELVSACYGGRYVLLLMGAFATYCGLIYNDFTSLSIHLFPTAWPKDASEGNFSTETYPFGVDWVWGSAGNSLDFLNSMKMKLAICFGVTQMVMGIFLSLLNHIHFKDYISIICEFIPQIIFMLSYFGYMVFVIIYKWTVDWRHHTGGGRIPNLIGTMINMVLLAGGVDEQERLYEGQETVQTTLLLLAGIAIPWMLIPKPLYLKNQAESRASARRYEEIPADDVSLPEYGGAPLDYEHDDGIDVQVEVSDVDSQSEMQHKEHDEEEEEFNFGEVAVHQMIHTIEFVLGAVSNTASYLRLWALSLAHAQLAEVFFRKLFISLMKKGPIWAVIGFSGFCGATFGVLLAMDVLECFLHALRLHWVEFQNKFYHADGIEFQPFSYVALLNNF